MSTSRVTTRRGIQIPEHQHSSDYVPHKSEVVIVPSTNSPNFGSMFTIDIRDLNVLLHELCLQFNMSAISTMTSAMFVPAQFFIDHIDVVMNGNIIDTYYPLDQFLQSQLFQRDEDRSLQNIAAGSYASTAQRTALATTNSSYYLPLFDFFRQGKTVALLENCHNVQLKIFMQPLANITSGSGTAVATINSCNLLMRVTRLREEEANQLKREQGKNKALHYKMNDLRTQQYTAQTGVSSVNIVLSAITGPVSHLIFVVRPSASLTGNNAYAFTPITSYEILNSSGQNFVGGQAINNSEALLVLGNNNSKSSYLTEQALGVTDNKANVYVYSFSSDCIESAVSAVSLGTHNFTGAEQLKITFTSALAANVQVDILAYTEALLSLGQNGVRKSVYQH